MTLKISRLKKLLEEDFRQTKVDFQDLSILVRRVFGLSHYGHKDGGEMTSREREDYILRQNSLWFSSENDFQLYLKTHKVPIGPCVVGQGKTVIRYNDIPLESLIKKKEINDPTYKVF